MRSPGLVAVNDPRRLGPMRLPPLQHPSEAIASELQRSLFSRADRKLKTTNKARIYHGSLLPPPQRFVLPPPGSVNTPAALESAGLKVNTRRSAGRSRASADIFAERPRG